MITSAPSAVLQQQEEQCALGIVKPFYRIYRPGAADDYIADPEYARNAEHYVRAYLLIQHDLQTMFEYVEPSDECRDAYSFRIHALILRTCVEVEANFKAILSENGYSPPKRQRLDMSHYRKVEASSHLSSYEVVLPIWNGKHKIFKPFEEWKHGPTLSWYQAYNDSKHDRHEKFRSANFGNLVNAVAGLLVLVSSQFHQNSFDAGPNRLIFTIDRSGPQHSIGSLFRVKFPDDWPTADQYRFDWEKIKLGTDRFQRFDFSAIP